MSPVVDNARMSVRGVRKAEIGNTVVWSLSQSCAPIHAFFISQSNTLELKWILDLV